MSERLWMYATKLNTKLLVVKLIISLHLGTVINGLLARGCSRTYLSGASPTHAWASPAYADLRGLKSRILVQAGLST